MKKIISVIAALLSLSATAQTFEDGTGYTTVTTYDSWADSPFRTGRLQPNVRVVDNPFRDKNNPTDKVLAYQRSRWASNMYGVRIDLTTTFELTPTAKYVHALIHKPKEGRVMCIGLGRQRGNTLQDSVIEQFQAMPTQTVGTDDWYDAVFPVRGAGDIDISSLVFVTDLESTDALTEDHIAYVDEIVVTDNPTPRIIASYYAVAVDKEQKPERDDFHLHAILFEGSSTERVTLATDGPVYRNMLDKVICLKAGEKVQPTLEYEGKSMNAYYYLDIDDNGQFDVNLSVTTMDNPLPEGTELLSYSFLEEKVGEYGFNSAGQRMWRPKRDCIEAPAFVIPSDLQPGFYRMRVKVDVANGDPAGRTGDSQGIAHNGGIVVDLTVNVMGEGGMVSQHGLNGDLCMPDGTIANNVAYDCGKPFTIRQIPAPGFRPGTVAVRYGYNLDGEQYVHENPQWFEMTFPASETDAEGMLTIPERLTIANMRLESDFISIK